MQENKPLGQLAFETYTSVVRNTDVYGNKIPAWKNLKPIIQYAWNSAALAVLLNQKPIKENQEDTDAVSIDVPKIYVEIII